MQLCIGSGIHRQNGVPVLQRSPRPERPEQATEHHRNFTVSSPRKGSKQCRLPSHGPSRPFQPRKVAIFFGVKPLPFLPFFPATSSCSRHCLDDDDKFEKFMLGTKHCSVLEKVETTQRTCTWVGHVSFFGKETRDQTGCHRGRNFAVSVMPE